MYVKIEENPFALLTCAGVKRAVSTKLELRAYVERVLIYAVDAPKSLETYPVEWQMLAHNEQLFGNIPHFVEQVSNAIIGWVDLIKDPTGIPPLWDTGENCYTAINAHFLEEPYSCILKVEGYYDNLPNVFPAFRCKPELICDVMDSLYIPVNPFVFKESARGTMINIDLFGEASKCLLNKNYTLKRYKSVLIYNDTKSRQFEFSNENYLQPSVDRQGDLKLYPSILRRGEKVSRVCAVIYLYDQLEH